MRDLLALHVNNDPFSCGTPAHRRDGEWFASVWHATCADRASGHVRLVHYTALSLEGLALPNGEAHLNTTKCSTFMEKAAKAARNLGLVDPAWFRDRRNPPPVLFSPEARLAEARPEAAVEPAWLVCPEVPPMGLLAEPLEIPDVEISGYDYEDADQPEIIEVWIEKSTMADVIEPVCRRYGANYVPAAGVQSISNAIRLLERVKAAGRPARIYYISDHDPAGEIMPISVSRHLEYWREVIAPGAEVTLTPLALTADQVATYDLPRIPNSDSDGRVARFEEAHGEGRVELDALEALRPGVLADLVEDALEAHVDPSLEGRLADARSEAVRHATRQWQAETAEEAELLDQVGEQIEEVTERYRPELENIAESMRAELAPLQGDLDEISDAVAAKAAAFTPDLPVRPGAEISPPDRRWLFDSGRCYLDQIRAYREGVGR